MNENETVLKEILEELHKREFAEFDDPENMPKHRFSLKHRLAMKRVFARYQRNVRILAEPQAAGTFTQNDYIPHYGLKQRITIALVIVFLMTLLTGWYIPIRSITQAQVDWLRSKYDFPNMLIWISEQIDNTVSNGYATVGA